MERSPGFRAQKQYSGGPQKLATSRKVIQDRLPSEALILSAVMYATPPPWLSRLWGHPKSKVTQASKHAFHTNDAEARHWSA